MLHVQLSPFEVVFLLCEACSSQSCSGLAQIANKIVAEVERHCVLICQQPPKETTLKEVEEEEETDS